MRFTKLRMLRIVLAAGAALTLSACGGSDSQEPGEVTAEAAEAAARDAEPGPPEDYVRYRCFRCSCRVYMGERGYCTQPSCRHHWKEHQRPPQE